MSLKGSGKIPAPRVSVRADKRWLRVDNEANMQRKYSKQGRYSTFNRALAHLYSRSCAPRSRRSEQGRWRWITNSSSRTLGKDPSTTNARFLNVFYVIKLVNNFLK